MSDKTPRELVQQAFDRWAAEGCADPGEAGRVSKACLEALQLLELGEAWVEAQAELPYQRWAVTLTGDWESGWEAEAQSSGVASEGNMRVATNAGGWGAQPGGHPTPAAAFRALAVKLREWQP